MITLKDLRENGKNKEELRGATENDVQNIAENKVSFDNLENNDDYWILMLFCLLLMQEHENEKLWQNFKEDIKYNSRFFPKCELLEKIDNVSVYASVKLCEGTILYRVREYKNDAYLKNKEVVAIYKKCQGFIDG